MADYVLDTNIITELIRPNEIIIKKYFEAGADGHVFLGCPIVYYEVKKGLIAKDKKKRMRTFETTFASFKWIEYKQEDWLLAAALWAKRIAAGRPIQDADLFIAVFALNNHATLVTNNVKDFTDLGVMLEDWSV